MRMDVSLALKNPGHEFPFALELPLHDQDFAGEEIKFLTPAKLKGTYSMAGAGVTVRGELECEYQRQCALCLGPVKAKAECEFEDLFYKEPNPEDPNDLFLIENYTIDMTAYAESVSSSSDAAPSSAVSSSTGTESFPDASSSSGAACKPGCKGLCPVCGTDLNVSQCSCGRADTPSETRKPFAALEDLLTRDEEV